MMSNLIILPMLLPFVCALILVFTKNKNRISKILSITTMIVNTMISIALLIYVVNHKPITLDFGGWKAPFGIQFLGDSLSLLMVSVSSFVVTRVVSEVPCRLPADRPIPRIVTARALARTSTSGSQGVPAYSGVHPAYFDAGAPFLC